MVVQLLILPVGFGRVLPALADDQEEDLHFHALTSMTPIQLQKQIRLHEARTRLLADSGDIAGT